MCASRYKSGATTPSDVFSATVSTAVYQLWQTNNDALWGVRSMPLSLSKRVSPSKTMRPRSGVMMPAMHLSVTLALDSFLKWNLELELSDLLADFTGPVLWVSHDLGECCRNCGSVCVMENGRSSPVTQGSEARIRARATRCC